MADLQKTIQILFTGSDKLSPAFDSIDKRMRSFADLSQSSVGAVAGFTTSILKLEAALGVAALALGGAAFAAAADFQDSLVDLSKVYDDSQVPLDIYVEGLRKLPLATNDAVQSAADYIKAGRSQAEAMELVGVAADFAVAGELAQADATQKLKIISEAYSFTAADLRTNLDFLNIVADNSATTVGLLGEAVARSANAAQATGLSFQELVAVLTPMVAKTQEGAQVGNALKTVLANLITPTAQQAAALDDLGIALTDSNGATKDAKQLLFEFIDAAAAAEGTTRAQTVATIAGAEQFSRFSAAIGGSADIQKILNKEFERGLSLEEEANRVRERSLFFLQQLNKAFTDAAVAVGIQYQGSVDDVIKSLTQLLGVGRSLVEEGAFDEFFDIVNDGLQSLSGTISDITRNLPAALNDVDFSPLTDAIRGLSDDLGGLFQIDLSTTEGLTTAIQFIIDTLASLTEFSGTAAGAISNLVTLALSVIEEINSWDASTIELAGNIGGLSVVLNQFLPTVNTLLLAFLAFGGASGAVTLAGSAFTALGVAVTSATAVLVGAGAAAGAAGAGIGLLINKTFEGNDSFIEFQDAVGGTIAQIFGLEDANDIAAKSLLKTSESVRKTSDEFGGAGEQIGAFGAYIDNLNDSTQGADDFLSDLENEIRKFSDEADKAAASANEFGNAIRSGSDELSDYELAVQGLGPVTKEIADQWRNSADELDRFKTVQQGVTKELDGSVTVYTQVSKAISDTGKTLDELAESGEIAKDKYAELKTEIEKAEIEAKVKLDIAELEENTERAKDQLSTLVEVTKLKVELDIARVQSDTEKVKALIGGIVDSAEIVAGNINTILGLIGALEDSDNLAQQKFDIFQQQLEIENVRLDQQFALQRELTQAQIDEIQARTRLLQRGDAIIKIDGTGLEPELNAFMFKILSNIQVRANSDAQAFLLGVG